MYRGDEIRIILVELEKSKLSSKFKADLTVDQMLRNRWKVRYNQYVVVKPAETNFKFVASGSSGRPAKTNLNNENL